MIKKNKTLIVIILYIILGSYSYQLPAQSNKLKKNNNPVISSYEKLFDKKRDIKSVRGLMTLHKIEDKLYIEMPLNLMENSFLMSSVVDNVGNMQLGYVGQRTSVPRLVSFSQTDSSVQIRLMPARAIVDLNDKEIMEAVKISSTPPVIYSTGIMAYSPDSSAVVFEATPFFVSGNAHIGSLNASSFGGFIKKVSNFSKELSLLKDVEAYENNVSVISNMTYTFKTYFLGIESGGNECLTAELRTTIRRLSSSDSTENQNIPYRHRIADYRIGTGVVGFDSFSSKEQGNKVSYFATRWRLEPKDISAYIRGELTGPVKPIVFYIDTLFPPTWRDAVKRGLKKWNKPFESIGFKDVIVTLDYPNQSSDKEFSASNNSYNCVRYAQLAVRDIRSQINIDPRNGEIIGATITFFRDSPVTLQRERFYQTAVVEPDVRGEKLPDNLMCSSIEMAMMREMGFCLGLTANMAASSWMPVDSLRSPTFTSKEGITSSVMDKIRYNYVAQPDDIARGVVLTASEPGVYDYYAIDWLYKPILEAETPEDEIPFLRKKIDDNMDDPRYFYGMEQKWVAYFDPRSVPEDLGEDKIKAAQYGVNTLKYICANGVEWINKDQVDESYRELFIDFVFLKLYDYYKSLMVNIGGIKINRFYDKAAIGDTSSNNVHNDVINISYDVVDREIQRSSLLYMLNQADDLEWMDQKDLLMMSGMNASFSKNMVHNLIPLVLQRIDNVLFAQKYSDDAYTADQMIEDIKTFAIKNIRQGIEPTEAQISTLFSLTKLLISRSSLPKKNEAKSNEKQVFQFAVKDRYDSNNYYSYVNIVKRCYSGYYIFGKDEMGDDCGFAVEEPSEDLYGFDPLTTIKYMVKDDLSPLFYGHLTDLKAQLRDCVEKQQSEQSKGRILYLLNAIDKAI